MKKVLVEKISGYNIWGEVNPKNNKLQNFTISGVGVNPQSVYVLISNAEAEIKRITGNK